MKSESLGSLNVARAIVRGVSSSFAACEREDRHTQIDVELAKRQHAAYVQAIRDADIEVVTLPAAQEHPDCVFVEDTAIVLDAEHVVIMRPGAPSRRGEVPVVAEALERLGMRLIRLPESVRIDGGDVLCVGNHLFIGLSGRTDRYGAEALSGAARKVGITPHCVEVRSGLHLKSRCSLADESILLFVEASGFDPVPMKRIGLNCVATREPMGGNVLSLGGGAVLVSDAAPQTAEILKGRGLSPRLVAMSELHKADGALTCPSIRIPPRGAWCT